MARIACGRSLPGPRQPKIILGLGTGRCGTATLTRLLDKQAGVIAEHETVMLQWEVKPYLFKKAWEKITEPSSAYVANISFAWLPYIPLAVEKDPEVKCICIKRDRQQTIESFSQHFHRFNVWTHYASRHFDMVQHSNSMARCAGFPKFDAPRLEAIGLYWDLYYQMSKGFQKKFPDNFHVWPIDAFNSEVGVSEMLTFAGLTETNVISGIKINERLRDGAISTRQSVLGEIKAA